MRRLLAHSLLNWALLAALTLMWGSAYAFIRIAVEEIPPATLVGFRTSIAALVLYFAVRLTGRRMPPLGPIWFWFIGLAAVGNVIPFFLISWGQLRIDSGLAGVLLAVGPLVTLVLAHFLVEDERMTSRRLLGFTLGLAGIVVLVGPDVLQQLGGEASSLWSQLAVLLAATSYALNAIGARRMPASDALSAAASVSLSAAVLTFPSFWLVDADTWGRIGPSIWIALLWLGILSTALGTVAFFVLIERAGPTFLSLVNYLIPFVALGAGSLLFAEAPQQGMLIALALILVGLATAEGTFLRN